MAPLYLRRDPHLGRRRMFLAPRAHLARAKPVGRSQSASFPAQGSAVPGRRRGFLAPGTHSLGLSPRQRIFARTCAMVAAKAPSSASPVLRAAVDVRSFLRKGRCETSFVCPPRHSEVWDTDGGSCALRPFRWCCCASRRAVQGAGSCRRPPFPLTSGDHRVIVS